MCKETCSPNPNTPRQHLLELCHAFLRILPDSSVSKLIFIRPFQIVLFSPHFFCLILVSSQRISLPLHALKHNSAFLLDTCICISKLYKFKYGKNFSGPKLAVFLSIRIRAGYSYLLQIWHTLGSSSA